MREKISVGGGQNAIAFSGNLVVPDEKQLRKKLRILEPGTVRCEGNNKPARSLVEPLQVAMDNRAKRALIPIENKRQYLEVNPDVLEQVYPIFYGDLSQAAFKALRLN